MKRDRTTNNQKLGKCKRATPNSKVATAAWWAMHTMVFSAIVMAYLGYLSWEIVAHILGTGFMCVVLLFIIFYINNSSEPSTFMVKLIGISLGTILTVFGLAANLALQIRDNAYDSERLIEGDLCRIAIQSEDYTKVPGNVAFILEHQKDANTGAGKDTLRYASKEAGFDLTRRPGIREAGRGKHIVGSKTLFRKYFSVPPYRAANFFLYYRFRSMAGYTRLYTAMWNTGTSFIGWDLFFSILLRAPYFL